MVHFAIKNAVGLDSFNYRMNFDGPFLPRLWLRNDYSMSAGHAVSALELILMLADLPVPITI